MGKYRVNESEHFNLVSMYYYLKEQAEVALRNDEPWQVIEDLYSRLEEIHKLMEAAPHIGAFVTWPELSRIREISDGRKSIRHALAIQNGAIDK